MFGSPSYLSGSDAIFPQGGGVVPTNSADGGGGGGGSHTSTIGRWRKEEEGVYRYLLGTTFWT